MTMSDPLPPQDEKLVDANPSWLRLLLLVPFIAVLWVPFYNRMEPMVAGIPFFYTYQMAWVLICAVIIGIVYKAEHK
jgi:hypothetical protein